MEKKQRTIRKTVSYTGIGLHTGEISTVTFKPANVNSGIIFKRVDLPTQPEIPADIEHVIDISRGTTIAIGDAKVCTIEHLLSAIVGLEIDNILVEIDGVEVPVADGSAIVYVNTIKKGEVIEQDCEKNYLAIAEPISFSAPDDNVDIVIVPSDTLKVTFLVDYNHPFLKTQYTSMMSVEKEFVPGFASAQTFAFLHEIRELKENNLIKGGSIDNALVIGEPDMSTQEINELKRIFRYKKDIYIDENTGLLNGKKLRYYNEFVRHKVVDLMGDIALLGIPLKGHIIAARSGHKTNVELIKRIRKLYEREILQQKYQKKKRKDVVFDINAIMRILPHRYPFLLVDKIISFHSRESIVGIKNVTINEPFFRGHFPGHPIMPGVLILEAMAQTGGVLLLNTLDDPENHVAYFVSIDKVKFRKPVLPGDQLRFEMKMINIKKSAAKIAGQAYVGESLVCEGVLTARIMDK